MLPSHTPSPAPDATVIRTGRRGAMTGLPCSVLLIAMGAVGVFGAVVVATGNQKGESNPAGYVGLVFMLLLGALGVFLFIGNWANRRARILVDATGERSTGTVATVPAAIVLTRRKAQSAEVSCSSAVPTHR